jgi:DNA-binding GntR family transcriptional regulator
MTQQTSKASVRTVVEYALETLRSGIKEGRYAPGQRLIEADLVRELGVSRGPVREALHRLAGVGLVMIEPHRGVVVRRLSRKDVETLYEVREVIEGLAARLATKNVKERKGVKQLRALRQKMRKAHRNKDVATYMEVNEELHQKIVELSDNSWLEHLVDHMHLHTFRLGFAQLMVRLEDMGASEEEHEKVIQAILDGDAQKAERAMRTHVRHSAKLVQKLPDSSFGQ